MTGICGLTGPNQEEVEDAVEKMLSAMEKRGTVTHTITSKISQSQNIAMGACEHSSDLPKVHEEPVDDSILVDGNFWGKEEASGFLQAEPKRLDALLGVPGAFSFLAFRHDGLVAGRDVLGQKPLYFGTDEKGRYAFASLKVALARIGVLDPQPVPTGELLKIEGSTKMVSGLNKLARPPSESIAEEIASERVGQLFLESVSKTVPEGSAVSFSGGIDSGLTAYTMKKIRLHTELITVGLQGQPELEHATQVAKAMGLKIRTRELAEEEVLDVLPSVVETVESFDPMVVSTAVPFHFVCYEARELDVDTVVAGQLSDELFGGYARFERRAIEGPFELVGEEMWNSVLAASNNDFEPGDKVAVSLGLELVCPFAYLPLVQYALSLPTSLKVKVEGENVVRKYILRRLAENWGLPRSIVERPKKAFQYSTGINRVLVNEAKRQGITVVEFLRRYLPSRQVYSTPT